MTTADSPTIALPPPEPGGGTLQPGQVLGGCRVERLLGQGGMGSVYLAVQASLDRPVALKVLAPSFARDESFVKRFDREAAALAALSHPNIVSIYDKGFSGEHYYFVMEYVEGATLRQVMRQAKLDPADAIKLVAPLCEALEYAHAKGVVHRDIKPENLLVARDGRVKIADFGLARLGGARPSPELTGPQTVMGTVHYMAPELQESAAQADPRSDLYSLGVVLYEMLTGTLPLGRFEPPSRRGTVDARFDEVVLKCLESDPTRRWQHASEIGQAVSRITTAPPTLQAELAGALKEVSSAPAGEFVATRDEAKPAKVRDSKVRVSSSVKKGILGRKKGEGRRQWKSRTKAMGFLGMSALGILTLYLVLPGNLRLYALAPVGGAMVIVGIYLALKSRKAPPRQDG